MATWVQRFRGMGNALVANVKAGEVCPPYCTSRGTANRLLQIGAGAQGDYRLRHDRPCIQKILRCHIAQASSNSQPCNCATECATNNGLSSWRRHPSWAPWKTPRWHNPHSAPFAGHGWCHRSSAAAGRHVELGHQLLQHQRVGLPAVWSAVRELSNMPRKSTECSTRPGHAAFARWRPPADGCLRASRSAWATPRQTGSGRSGAAGNGNGSGLPSSDGTFRRHIRRGMPAPDQCHANDIGSFPCQKARCRPRPHRFLMGAHDDGSGIVQRHPSRRRSGQTARTGGEDSWGNQAGK